MITLPTQKTKPQFTLNKLSMLLYGAPKIGKSTFCSRADDALFIATEPGLNHLETFNIPVNSWKDFNDALTELEKGGHPFKTLIIDTVDKLCDFCEQDICAKNKVETLLDFGYGKGFSIYKTEMIRALQRIFSLGMGVIMTSHSQLADVDTPQGRMTKWTPTFAKRIQDVVIPLIDIIAFAQSHQTIDAKGERVEERVMQVQPSSLWIAGDRTGRLPATMPFKFAVFKRTLEAKKSDQKTEKQ